MLIPLPLLLAAQHSLNTLLSLQVQRESLLEPLVGRVIALHVRGLDATVFLLFSAQGIELSRYHDGEVDVTLSGAPLNLLSMTHDNDALYQGRIDIQGDTGTARLLQQAMQAMEIDWEEHLSRLIGDTPAHQLGRAQRGVHQWLQRALSGFVQDSGDYLQDETQLLAPVTEIQRFCRDVDTLRNDTERMQARIARLQQLRSLESGGS